MKPKRLLALGVLLVGVTAAASLIATQKPAPPQPTEQQKLKERVDALESQLKESQAKADRAAMEKDYIERIQKEVNAYYERAFATQIAIVSIAALFLAAAGAFGVNNLVQSKLTAASATLREEFSKALDDRFAQLETSHAAHLKELEGNLQERISSMGEDLDIRSKFSSWSLQGMAMLGVHQNDDAVNSFRKALNHHVRGKDRRLFSPKGGVPIIANLLLALKRMNPNQFEQAAKKELADPLYDELEVELAIAALEKPELASLIRDRNASQTGASPSATTPDTAPPPPDNGSHETNS